MKKSLDKKLKAIVVLSGGSKQEDLERAKKAIEYNQFGLPYIISGLGPDTNEALEKNNSNLDYHKDLHNYILGKTNQYVGVDIQSKNSLENIKNTFPLGLEGKFAIVSYPLHLERVKLIFNNLKSRREISSEVELELIPTKQSLRQYLYGKAALLKQKSISKEDWGKKFPLTLLKRIFQG